MVAPGLPRFLRITVKLAHHQSALRPFLDSLPAPFEWGMETPAAANERVDILDSRMQAKYKSYMSLADTAKVAGNDAFGHKDRDTALQKYSEATNLVTEALAQRPNDVQKRAANKLMAVCLSNRAATYLLPGDGSDAAKALEDAEKAERYDADYGKA